MNGVLVDVRPPSLEVTIDDALLKEGRLSWSLISEAGARVLMSGADGLPGALVLAGTTQSGDIELPSGDYELRIVAADLFGHETEQVHKLRVESAAGTGELIFGLALLAGLLAGALWGSRRLFAAVRSRVGSRRAET